MFTLREIIWLFPIIFIFHDFEEIIWIASWKKKNKKNFEKSKKRKMPYEDFKSCESFSFAVYEEFIIIVIVTLFAFVFEFYLIWYGLFFAITLHFVIHILWSIRFGHIVPGLITSILVLPSSIYLLYMTGILLDEGATTIIIYCLTSSIVFMLNLGLLHKLMPMFNQWFN